MTRRRVGRGLNQRAPLATKGSSDCLTHSGTIWRELLAAVGRMKQGGKIGKL